MICQWKALRISCRVGRIRLQPNSRRGFSALPSPERVVVPVQSNGSIQLDIHQPSSRLTEHANSPRVLIYLPRGPYLHSEDDDSSTVSTLQTSVAWPIVQINYRLSQDQRFPTPIHDVLAGYEWILRNLLPKRAINRTGRSENVGRIAVCGELVGGGLATALALTECRVGEPGIVAAAVNSPLIDWTALEESNAGSVKRSSRSLSSQTPGFGSDVNDILSLRTQLFRRPADYFDPFASPTLFFRSAGTSIPAGPTLVPADDMEHLSILEREEFLRGEGLVGRSAASLEVDKSNENAEKPQRKASKRFPSKALGLRLPSFHISTGSASPLDIQATEFTTLLRQSIIRQSKYAASNAREFGRKVLLDDEEDDNTDAEQLSIRNLQRDEANEKAQRATHEGLGLWDSSPNGKVRVLEAAEWLKRVVQ